MAIQTAATTTTTSRMPHMTTHTTQSMPVTTAKVTHKVYIDTDIYTLVIARTC